MDEIVIAFHTTHDAIRAEKKLNEAGLPPRVMPLPFAIRAGCGICLRLDAAALGPARALLSDMNASWHVRRATEGGSEYREVEM